MGEYLIHKGTEIKIGTCENLYYARYQDIADHLGELKKGMDGTPEEYIKESAQSRFRFPFPDEDSTGIGNYEEHDRGILFELPLEFMHQIEHRKISTQITTVNGCYKETVQVLCPADKTKENKFVNIKSWNRPDGGYPVIPVYLKQQKIYDGRLLVICECAWCGTRFNTPAEFLDVFIAAFKKYYCQCEESDKEKYNFYWEIEERILAGYEMTI